MKDQLAHSRRHWMWVLGVGLFCGSCQPTSPPGPTTLKLGTLLPLTGDLAQYGSSMQNAARLAIDTLNSCGGVLGQPIDLIAEDDQTDPVAGTAAMTKLTEVDKVSAVIGGSSSAVASSALSIGVRNQTLLISPSSTSPTLSDRSRKGEFNGFWARTAPPDSFQGEALAKLAKTRGFKTVAVMAINNDYGNGLIESFVPTFEKLGGRVINKEQPVRYAPDSSTFDSLVTAAFKDTPDAVLLISYPETGSLILRTAYQQGFLGKKTQIIVTDGLKDANLAESVGRTTNGEYIAADIIGTAPHAGGPASKPFQEKFSAKFQKPPAIYDPNTWDAIAVTALAAEAAKSAQSAVIRTKLSEVANPPGEKVSDICQAMTMVRQGKDINYQGASSAVDFNGWGDVTGSYDVWTINSNGEIQTIGAIAVDGQ